MLTSLDLWLPILLSAVSVFIVSSVIHMCLPFHKGDYAKLPGEEKVLGVMGPEGVQPGDYMFPFPASMKEMGSPEMLEKLNRGPVGFLTVIPNGPFTMGRNLVQWFILTVVIGFFVAYLAALGLPRGAEFMEVFRLTSTAGILGYAAGNIPNSIWRGVRWGITAKFVIDGIVYGLVTGAVFGWLWPGAS